MMVMRKLVAALLIIGMVAGAGAETIFTFHDEQTGIALDGQSTGSVTVDGIELSATVGHAGDEFNDTSSSFGINATGTGDDTDLIDDGSGVAEYFTFSFDQAVTINRFDLGGFTGSEGEADWDAAYITFGSHSENNIDKLGNDMFSNNTQDYLDGSWDVDANEDVTLGFNDTASGSSANGFDVDSISVIPEPTTFTLVALLSAATLLRRKLFQS